MIRPKKYFFLFILALAFMLCGDFLCHAAEQYPAMVEDISGDRYLPAVKEALGKAEKSIDMVMYLANFDPESKKSAVTELVTELANAHERGVKVKVILDQNVPFSEVADTGNRLEREERNDAFLAYLKGKGIEAYYDNIFTVTHSKLIVIDNETVIVGSTNWTDAALGRNEEASCLIRSKELAGEFLADIARIKLDKRAVVPDEENAPAVRISDRFLLNRALVPRMIGNKDSTALDLYLLLLKKFDGNAEGRLDLDYEVICDGLGVDKKLSYKSRRARAMWALKRLEKKYKLIKQVHRTPQGPYCLLLDFETRTPYTVPEDGYFLLPDTYWQYGWNKVLTGPEKACLLVNYYKLKNSGRIWSGYNPAIMDEFHLADICVSKGMTGLRDLNIIEIAYAPFVKGSGFSDRGPTQFCLRGLYSPQELQLQKQELASAYGKERFETAEKYAKIVFKDNDIRVIEKIIKLMDEYGEEEVKNTFSQVSQWSPQNPRRTIYYVIGILRNDQNKE